MNPKILIVEDNDDLRFSLTKVLKKEGLGVFPVQSGEEGLDVFSKELIDLVLLDLKLPKMGGIEVLRRLKEMDADLLVIMMTASTDVKPAIDAIKQGAYDYLMKPFELDEMRITIQKAMETQQLKREVSRLRREHSDRYPNDSLFGDSPSIQDIRKLIQIVAQTPKTSVLIQGESGTGKELVANAIHYSSARAAKPFIKINCSAIPDNLLESELFGHEKGAFTDAKAMKKGLFELANGGTIFLDEISSMRLTLQPKILRIIESQTFRRIGGTNDITLDIRIVAASNTDLAVLVENKEFREDLFYRLKVMEITLTPLRERKDDVLLLAKIFLQEYNREFNRHIQHMTPETEALMMAYSWPGNVRELKNVMERAVILCPGNMLTPEQLPIELKREGEQQVPRPVMGLISLEDMEKTHIAMVLEQVQGNKSKAARVLDISRSTLREKLKAYGLV